MPTLDDLKWGALIRLARLFDRWNLWMHRRGSAKMVFRQGEQYLERRYLLHIRSLTIFLHTFWMDDPDPLHDHPWPFGRIIVWGRYREHYHDGTFQDFGPGHVVWNRESKVLHRVELLTDDVWTIFWHWKRDRTWGFLYPEGWRATSDDGQDGRPLKGWFLPRKVGEPPKEVVHS